MMTTPPKPTGGDEICPLCKKPKSEHTNKEMLDCSRKIRELETKDEAWLDYFCNNLVSFLIIVKGSTSTYVVT